MCIVYKCNQNQRLPGISIRNLFVFSQVFVVFTSFQSEEHEIHLNTHRGPRIG